MEGVWLMGTETEYGISCPGRPDLDQHALSALVVDACDVPATSPVADVHNRVLGNGARLYVDHGHPEYAGPETTNPTDALTWELAGDALVARAAARASAEVGAPVRVFRNNTDGKGASYGYHENYLLRRDTPFERVVAALPAVLVSRVVLGGAGRVGLGPTGAEPGFQLSQRADFFERVAGLETTRNRGLVNTRDEPHARHASWRRLHVIAGDATRSPSATWLKLGVLALCLEALEADALPTVDLADPVAAFRTVSRDVTLAVLLPLAGGGAASALDLQERFRDACAAHASAAPEAPRVLAEWTRTLDDLRRGRDAVADRLDWAAKLALLEGYRRRDRLDWRHPRLAQLDLAWAELGDDGVVPRLQRTGRLPAGPGADRVERATRIPPADTRAASRGGWVTTHPDAVVAATWDSLLVRDSRGALHNLRMREPHAHTRAAFDASAPVDRLIADQSTEGTA